MTPEQKEENWPEWHQLLQSTKETLEAKPAWKHVKEFARNDIPVIVAEMIYTAEQAAAARAREEEREACAKVAEVHRLGEKLIRRKMSELDQVAVVSDTIAQAIRARGEGGGE